MGNASLDNAKPFDPTNFDPFNPEAWAGFANMCRQMYGYQPSNQEMVQFFMMRMSMMGVGPSGGMGPQAQMQMQGQGAGQGFGGGQDIEVTASLGVGAGLATNGATGRQEQARESDQSAPQQAKGQQSHGDQAAKDDENEGEADMDVASDAE